MIKTYPINEDLAGLVPMANEAEQLILKNEIREENGLLLPVILWRGHIVDGRCRQKACSELGIEMLVEELDPALTYDEVARKVKGYNSRRNLTPTQKVMAACRQSLKASCKLSTVEIAKAWGISRDILGNARFIANTNPEWADTLFNGGSVKIIDHNGNPKLTNKVTTIYAYLKKLSEAVREDTQYAWQEDTYIKTQAGKEWYYSQVSSLDSQTDIMRVKMLLAELANYKFSTGGIND